MNCLITRWNLEPWYVSNVTVLIAGQLFKVLDGLGDGLAEEADFDSAGGSVADLDFELDYVGDFWTLGLPVRGLRLEREEGEDEEEDGAAKEDFHGDLCN